MKSILSILPICLLFIKAAAAQSYYIDKPLLVGYNKTVSIVFPFAIKNVDRGSRYLLVQKVKETANVLKVKASSSTSFKETNLTVITADGKLYSFIVNYTADLPISIIHINSESNNLPAIMNNQPVILNNSQLNEKELSELSQWIMNDKKLISSIHNKGHKVKAAIEGIYIRDHALFFKLSLENASAMGYDIDFIRFYIRDKKQGKRTASQQAEITPLYAYGILDDTVKEGTENTIVFSFEKFTMEDKKNLFIEIFEKNGGRHMTLEIKNGDLVKAKKASF